MLHALLRRLRTTSSSICYLLYVRRVSTLPNTLVFDTVEIVFCRSGHQQYEQRVHSHTKSYNPGKFDSSAIFCVESIFEVKTFIARVPTELCNFPHFVPKNLVFRR